METCVLKLDHLPNLLFRRLYRINNWGLHFPDVYSSNRLAMSSDEEMNFWNLRRIKTYSPKLGYILKVVTVRSEIVKFLGFTKFKIIKNHKLLSHNTVLFGGKIYPYPKSFWKIDSTTTRIPFVKWETSSCD